MQCQVQLQLDRSPRLVPQGNALELWGNPTRCQPDSLKTWTIVSASDVIPGRGWAHRNRRVYTLKPPKVDTHQLVCLGTVTHCSLRTLEKERTANSSESRLPLHCQVSPPLGEVCLIPGDKVLTHREVSLRTGGSRLAFPWDGTKTSKLPKTEGVLLNFKCNEIELCKVWV